ncbi:hypothetical protein, partial [Methylobacterium crusticola]|uniref:hypothetical protein n=1 Tax=Methylobacterium crusticola TaxID=1697972 RepID=UPI001EE21973
MTSAIFHARRLPLLALAWLIDNQQQVWSGDPAVIPASAPVALYRQDGITRIPTTGIESITLGAHPEGHREWLDGADG